VTGFLGGECGGWRLFVFFYSIAKIGFAEAIVLKKQMS